MSGGTPFARVVVTAFAVLLAAACNSASRGSPGGATVPTEPATTTTTAASYDVPAVTDAAYVEKVIAALDHVLGDGIRLMVREGTLTVGFLDHIVAIYSEEQFERKQLLWATDLEEDLKRRPPVPGDPVTKVQRLVKAEPTCIVAAVDRSFAATVIGEEVRPTQQEYIALVPRKPGRDPRGLNPTPWVMSFDAALQSGGEPEDPCRDQ